MLRIAGLGRLVFDSPRPLVRQNVCVSAQLLSRGNFFERTLRTKADRHRPDATNNKETSDDHQNNKSEKRGKQYKHHLHEYRVLKSQGLAFTISLNEKRIDDHVELIKLQQRVDFIERYGAAIEDFALSEFELFVGHSDPKYEDLRTTYTKFFMEPTEDQQSLSTLMKRQILEIEELKNHDISEIIDRFLNFISVNGEIYRLISEEVGENSIKELLDLVVHKKLPKPRKYWSNKDILQSLVDKAPAIQDYDEELRMILVSQIDFDKI